MKKLYREDIKKLLWGSVFYGCGGGLAYKESCKIAEEIFKVKKFLVLNDINEFKNNDYLISIYAVGDPSKVDLDFKSLILKAFKAYKKLSNIYKVSGIIPGEIGAEVLAFQASAYLNLPVVDTDLVGGRAAPEIQMDMFSVYKLRLTPFLAYVNDKTLYFEGDFKAQELESICRNFFHNNKGSGIVIGYPIKVTQIKNKSIRNTVSNALLVGDFLVNKKFDKLKNFLEKITVLEDVFQKADLESKEGFLQGVLFFKNHKIYVKNENIYLMNYKGEIIYKAPDLIVVVDNNLKPVHNTEWKNKNKQEVKILLIPSKGYWRKNIGKKLWNYLFKKYDKIKK
jgi:DUF917 family protein